MNNSEVKIGSIVIVKVAKNEIQVEVTGVNENSWTVKNPKSGKEFKVGNFVRIVKPVESPSPKTAQPPEKPKTKLSLLDAAHQVLKNSGKPMNTKEMISAIIEAKLWEYTNGKTPEQSLYSAIFREIKSEKGSRFRKSEIRKGSFELA